MTKIKATDIAETAYLTDAPNDGGFYVRCNGEWVDVTAYLNNPVINPSATKWRMFVTSINGGALCSIGELYLYTDEFNTDVATTGTPTMNTYYGPFPPANFLDRNNGSFSSMFPGDLPGWFQVEFTEPQEIIGFGVYPRSGELDNSPKDFTLQYFNGESWVTTLTITNQTGWSATRRDYYANS